MLALVEKTRKGIRKRVTEVWIQAVVDSMRERGMSRKDLAAEMGCSAAYVSRLLSGDYETSRLVDAISIRLGVSLSSVDGVETPLPARLSESARNLSEESIGKLIEYADFLAARQDSDD